MKKSLLSAAIILGFTIIAKPASIIVQEFGNCPSCTPAVYGSIDTAVVHANGGDTIFIKNRAGNVPWVEGVAINKSLDLVPYNNDSLFYCQGAWTITPSASMIVNIIGMVNSGGSVSSSADNAGARCIVRLLGGAITSIAGANTGPINFNNNLFDLTVYGMKVTNNLGYPAILFRHGNIIGDSIYSVNHGIQVNSEATATTDTTFIQGNVITAYDVNSTGNHYSIYWNCNSVFFDMRNNLIFTYQNGIYVSQTRNVNSAINKIYNCTVDWIATSANAGACPYYCYQAYGIYLNATSPGVVELQNNLVARNTGASVTGTYNYGLYYQSGVVNLYYNYVDKTFTNPINGAFTSNVSSTINQGPLTLGAGPTISSTYPPSAGSLGYQTTAAYGINGGNPGTSFYNLDLTQNTVGAYGGSYTLKNYFPTNTGATRVFMTSYPAVGNIGSNLSGIKAISFDR